jgi:predicted Zn-ribbon and HTH transcriptional regulator
MSLVNPNQCPNCKSESIGCGPIIEEDSKTLARWLECEDCGSEWYEKYRLSTITVADFMPCLGA